VVGPLPEQQNAPQNQYFKYKTDFMQAGNFKLLSKLKEMQ